MLNVEYWWPQPIWFDTLTGLDFHGMSDRCLEMEKQSPGVIISNDGGWQSDPMDISGAPDFKDLYDAIMSKSQELSVSQGDHFQLHMNAAWFNINRGRDRNRPHVHPFAQISGVVYLKASRDSGSIEFFRPDCQKHYYNGYTVPWNHALSGASIRYQAEIGKIVMFPAWLEHGVTESNDDQARISLAFNLVAVSR